MEEKDLIRPALRRATFPKGEGFGWFNKLQLSEPKNDTERAVRPQGIGIIMIAGGNHTIM